MMTHVRPVSQRRPVKAQFEPALQFVGLLQSIKGFPGILLGQGAQAAGIFSTLAVGLNTFSGMIQTLLTFFGIAP